MKDTDLHNLFSALETIQPDLPAHQARLRAHLVRQAAQPILQPSRLQRLWAFFNQPITGDSMKIPFASPLLAIGVVLVTGTAGATAFYLFKTQVSSSSQDNTVSINVQDCPSIAISPAGKGAPSFPAQYSYSAKYQIMDSSKITESQIKAGLLAMCEGRAIDKAIVDHLPDLQTAFQSGSPDSPPQVKPGFGIPINLGGIVSAIKGDQITIDNLSPNSSSAQSAAFTLASDAVLIKDGQPIPALHVGDQVHFIYQNQLSSLADPRSIASLKTATDPGVNSVIRGAGVGTTDFSAWSKLMHAQMSGAVKILQSSDTEEG